jgi:hypothetical protein
MASTSAEWDMDVKTEVLRMGHALIIPFIQQFALETQMV